MIGNVEENFPGIDGTMNGVDVSLKRYTGNSPQGVMKYAFEAETKALNAGYKGVDVYIDAKGLNAEQVKDFVANGKTASIPAKGITPNIYVNTSDGWVHISTNGINIIKK